MHGDRIGRYVVVDTIGVGAMGTVYAAFDPELARTVALKVVRSQAGHGLRMRLLREAQAMARVVHPNVVPIFDVGEHDDRLYLAMERIEGTSLRRWLARTKPTLPAVLDVLVQAGRGLAAAHREGLVHRDFKPENVLVARDGRACVTDFGLARPRIVDAATPGPLGVTLTHEGDRIGTPAYMAPEQRRGEPADLRSDLYAFCLVLYEGCFGARPGEAMISLRSVPRWLRRILARGLAVDPADRFASMDALLAEVELHRDRGLTLARRAAIAIAIAGTVGFGFATVADVDDTSAPCADREPDEAIGDSRLDEHVAAWRSTQREVCEATWIRGEQSPELLEARTACLHSEWIRLRSTVTLARSHPDRARALIEGLPPPDRCRTTEDEPSRDARGVLVRADTLRLAGRTDEALALLQPIVPQVRGPLLAEALVVLAQLEPDASQRRATLDQALRLARVTQRPKLEAEVWLALAATTPDERPFCTRMALAAIDAAGGDAWLHARASSR